MLDKKLGIAEWNFVSSSDSVCLTYVERWDGTEENLISVINSGSQADVLPHVSHWFEGSWSRCRALPLFFPPLFFSHWQISISSSFFFVEPPSLPLSIGISRVSMPLYLCVSASFLSSLSFLVLGHSRGSDTRTHTCRGVSFVDVAGMCASGLCQSERCHWRVIVINVGVTFPQ